MSKGSTPRPFTDREIFEANFDKIFKKPMTHKALVSKMLENPEVSKALAEYELHPSTGEVVKVYKDGC
jgi:hypothetical protein